MLVFRSRQGSAALSAILAATGVLLLIGIMIFMIDPPGQLREARDVQRQTDIETIMNAIAGYARDNDGHLPFPVTSSPVSICRSGVNLNCGNLINLNVLTGAYLRAMPADPKNGTAISTAYTLMWDGTRMTIAAPSAEQEKMIEVMWTVSKENP
jgi:hypothetical protein